MYDIICFCPLNRPTSEAQYQNSELPKMMEELETFLALLRDGAKVTIVKVPEVALAKPTPKTISKKRATRRRRGASTGGIKRSFDDDDF